MAGKRRIIDGDSGAFNRVRFAKLTAHTGSGQSQPFKASTCNQKRLLEPVFFQIVTRADPVHNRKQPRCIQRRQNAVPRPPEVLVDGDTMTVIRRRETYDDLVGPELEPQTV